MAPIHKSYIMSSTTRAWSQLDAKLDAHISIYLSMNICVVSAHDVM